MTPFGDVGRRGVRAYAARSGQTEQAYLNQLGDPLTPEIAGSALVDLVRADPATTAPGYLLTGAGLRKLPPMNTKETKKKQSASQGDGPGLLCPTSTRRS